MKGINKTIKIVTFLTVAIMLVMTMSTVFAGNTNAKVGTDPSTFNGQGDKIDTTGITAWSNSIINVVSIVGSAAAIIILIILGVKYMMGSAEEKAEYKKTLLPYIIGAVFVFGASVLTKVIYDFIK